ncbi:DUF3368 domain-containing protein [Gloeobacter morelensis]|uniref:Uncharacterized protein n=1 Tax=Gloeobacter morelensis MG652769 TaxID=2781736 RepID=A0ABY3PI78_9CYAN|nr:DUF3368 domain-containing protein [Gloeobacter morelensis]UFP93361.1 hypothetical protein ISF26_16350 [Gloeobacter morelensis MG652769]
MPEVIAGTSLLQYLYQAEILDLLRLLYGYIVLAVKPAVDRLEALGFRLAPSTRAAVLELAEEV